MKEFVKNAGLKLLSCLLTLILQLIKRKSESGKDAESTSSDGGIEVK